MVISYEDKTSKSWVCYSVTDIYHETQGYISLNCYKSFSSHVIYDKVTYVAVCKQAFGHLTEQMVVYIQQHRLLRHRSHGK